MIFLYYSRFSSWSHEIISDNDIAENLIDSKLRGCDLKPRIGARDILQEVLKEQNVEFIHPSTNKKEPTCHSNYPVFIVIPFRNRDEHLSILLPFLHRFLQEQNLNYSIVVVEQTAKKAFNRYILLFVCKLVVGPSVKGSNRKNV